MIGYRIAALSALVFGLAGCATPGGQPSAPPQDAFFAGLKAHCGKAYAGKVVSNEAADNDMRGKALVMHVRGCYEDRIEIPFNVGDDRSRTWVITRTGQGLRLKHDHRHQDGSADPVTMYGGDTKDAGTAQRQTFPVDAESIAMFRANKLDQSVTNIWAVEQNGQTFAYELRRANRFFRVEFDLSKPVPPPPASWGW